jgi:phage baseplate assembly protein W
MTNDAMSSAFLGVGVAFPVHADADGQLALAHYEESVREAIWIVLGTAPGERVMRPDFGCGIHELVFSVNDTTTAGRASDAVRRALTLWEPRIELINVDAGSPPGDAATLLIRIEYRVRATNNVFNVVYPFYLDRGGP